jgi:stage IV sporulation protein FB
VARDGGRGAGRPPIAPVPPAAPTLRPVNSRAHFRIFGVPVRVEPFFVIVAVLFGIRLEPLWVVFAWVVIVFFAVLIHELGHALTYRAFGQRSAVVLHGFGGFTIPTGGGRRALDRPRSIIVSLSGAIVQLLVVWLPARFLLKTDWAADEYLKLLTGDTGFNWFIVLYYVQFVGLWWAVFNLLPIRPLDGGHVAEELVGFENACKLSIAAAAIAAFVAFREDWIGFFGLMFFGLLAYLNFRDLREGQHATAFDVEAPESAGGGAAKPRRGGRAPRGRKRGTADLQVLRGGGLADAVPDLTPRPNVAQSESQAWNALRSGEGGRAQSLVERAGDGVSPFLRASVALLVGPPEMADDLFEAAYKAEPGGPPNLVPATLLADQGRAAAVASRLVEAGPVGIEAAGGLQTHLHYADRFPAAAEVGELVFRAGPRSPAQTAFEVACSWARAGNPDIALRWVGQAVDAGFRAPGLLDGEPDLAPVRALSGWAAVRARLSA